MRYATLVLALVLVLTACGRGDDTETASSPATSAHVLVIADGSAGDLAALELLASEPGVAISGVIITTTGGAGCGDVQPSIGEALGEASSPTPIVCDNRQEPDGGPSNATPGPVDSLDAEALSSVAAVLVLAPMSHLVSVLDLVPDVPVFVAPGDATAGVHRHIGADPESAQQVIAARPVTFVLPTVVSDINGLSGADAAELAAARLIIDEDIGAYRIERAVVTDTGTLQASSNGEAVRFLEALGPPVPNVPAPPEPTSPVSDVRQPELLWRLDVGGGDPGVHRRAAVAGDVVIVGGGAGMVYAVAPATGAVEWTLDSGLDGEFASNVAYEDGVAVLSHGSVEDAASGSVLAGVDVEERSLLWAFDAASLAPDMTLVSNAALADGVAYAGASSQVGANATGFVFALDLRSGELLWMSPGLGGASEPLIDGNDLIVGGGDGTVRVYDRRSGELRWEQSVVVAENGIASRPLAVESVIYVTGDDGSIHAFDQDSGEQIWRRQLSAEPIPASPILAEGRLIVAELFAGTTWALDPATGATVWSVNAGAVLGDPLVVGDTIVVTNFGPPVVVALDIETGTEIWRFDNPEIVGGTPILVDEVVIYQGVDVYGLQVP